MTFSDTAVVDYVKKHYNAVWTSVAPITEVVIDIGDGRKVTGATNGEIAAYVCRSDGKAIDVLPGLRSAQETLDFLVGGLDLLQATDGEEVRVRRELTTRFLVTPPAATAGGPLSRTGERGKGARAAAPSDLEAMVSKSIAVAPSETLLVAQPRTKDDLQREARRELGRQSLRSPADWSKFIFEELMDQPLVGGRRELPSATPVTVRRS